VRVRVRVRVRVHRLDNAGHVERWQVDTVWETGETGAWQGRQISDNTVQETPAPVRTGRQYRGG